MLVQTSSGIVRRNRLHLVPRLRDPIQNYTEADVDIDITSPDQPLSDKPANAEVRPRSPIRTHLQTGTTYIKGPKPLLLRKGDVV